MISDAVRALIRQSPLYDPLRRWRQKRDLRRWEESARRAPPPPLFKQRLVRAYAERHSLQILVETGTHLGDMVFATRDAFRAIYSVELDRRLYERARKRFSKDDHVHLVPGDGYDMLTWILPQIDRPCLFWLDAHWMVGGVRGRLRTPVVKELGDILERDCEADVILVDDARLLTGRGDYPSVGDLRDLIVERRPDWVFDVEDDVIRSHRPT